jgi:leucyl-tRNA synthetase
MPVDLYIGGAEHAVLHLLYARFWHKVLFDRGHVTTVEPFQKLVNQGMILGELEITGYQRADGGWVSAEQVVAGPEDKPVIKGTGEQVTATRVAAELTHKQGENLVLLADSEVRLASRAHKMSKARGNVVNPDEVVKEYCADALRLFEMFMGPLEATKPWSMEGVNGLRGFLDRVWRMIVDERADDFRLNPAVVAVEPTVEQDRVLHRTIQAVTQDIERMSFNTAIAKMMEFTNFFLKCERRPRVAMEKLVLLLSPFAPHLGEELWSLLGHDKSLAYESWPQFDESRMRQDTVEIPVQVNGKLRSRVTAPVGATREEIEQLAREDPRTAEHLVGKAVVKVIVVPGRLVNFVTE